MVRKLPKCELTHCLVVSTLVALIHRAQAFRPVFSTIIEPCAWTTTELAAHEMLVQFRNYTQ